jgi:hypothetical protein
MKNFQKGTKSHKELPKMPKCDFVQFWKFLVGLFAILEVPHGIVHI